MILHKITVIDYKATDRATTATMLVPHNMRLLAVLRDSGYNKSNVPDVYVAVTEMQTGVDAAGDPIMTPISDSYEKITDPTYRVMDGGLVFVLNPRVLA